MTAMDRVVGGIFGKKRPPHKKKDPNATPALSDDPKRLIGQINSRAVTLYFRKAPEAELIKVGRSAVRAMIGAAANPKAEMLQDLYETSPEFREQQIALLLRDQEAEIAIKEAKAQSYRGGSGYRGDDDSDDLSATLKQYMQGLLLDRLQNGPERSGFLEALAGVARELAPALRPVIAQAMNGGQPAAVPVYAPRELPPVQMGAEGGETTDEDNIQQEGDMALAEDPPKVLDLFGPDDIKRLFGLGDWDQAGEDAYLLVEEAIDAASPLKALQLRITASTFPNVPFEAIIDGLQEYKQYPAWVPVVAYIEQHAEEFGKFQASFQAAMQAAVGA